MAKTYLGETNSATGRRAWLRPDAAAAYRAMVAAGMPRGSVTDSGRTRAEQEALWRAYREGRLKATAARPGTSKHETGTALDLAEPARSWVRHHGAAYGWRADLVPHEPWHFEFVGATARALRRGMRGEDVRRLQRRLNVYAPAYSRLVVDGSFGPATDQVVRELQRRAGLAVDGSVGPQTRRVLGL